MSADNINTKCTNCKQYRTVMFIPDPAVLRIRVRIRIHVFLGHPDPDPLVRSMDPDPDPQVRGMDPDPDLYLAISAFFRLFINQAVSDWHFKKKLAKCFFQCCGSVFIFSGV
jgi:hypothetical protein